jgi:hypothetical protein
VQNIVFASQSPSHIISSFQKLALEKVPAHARTLRGRLSQDQPILPAGGHGRPCPLGLAHWPQALCVRLHYLLMIATLDFIITPRWWTWQIAPGGGFIFSGRLPLGVKSSLKSKIQLLDTFVYTSRFSTRKPEHCDNHIYNFHVSELLSLTFGCSGGCRFFCSRTCGPPGVILTCNVFILLIAVGRWIDELSYSTPGYWNWHRIV